jgi:hypothetical protein
VCYDYDNRGHADYRHHHLLVFQRRNSLGHIVCYDYDNRGHADHRRHHLLVFQRRFALGINVHHFVELCGHLEFWRRLLLLSQRRFALGINVHHVVELRRHRDEHLQRRSHDGVADSGAELPVPHRQHRWHVVLRCLHNHLLLSQRRFALGINVHHVVELRRRLEFWRRLLLLSQRRLALGINVHHVV